MLYADMQRDYDDIHRAMLHACQYKYIAYFHL